jgi:predicted dehydrogenase/threonine dehydrogenase-like Zn-dependent dehydrogenase
MRQVVQDVRSGKITVAVVPAPQLLPGCVLVRTAASLVSAGTERAASEFARKNLLQKARMRPDLVREVMNKIKRDGLLHTAATVRSRLDQPSTLGYSSAGTVMAVGEGVTDLGPGDRVACAGAGHAVHAEFACVPRLLVGRIPSDSVVSFEQAAFTTVGAVALHAVRTADVRLGDVVAVIGLGLLGQLTVQILKSAGCCVLGLDIAQHRAELASRLGANATSSAAPAFHELCLQHTAGRGVDAVLVTAQTSSHDPLNLAGQIARDRAVIAVVGVVGMEIDRRIFYQKELDLRVPRSYGPGRYDAAYEQKGIDYPVGYVRWTENRNMEAFLRLLAEGQLNLSLLITHRFPVERAQAAYDLITGQGSEPSLGVLITYPEDERENRRLEVQATRAAFEAPGTKSVSVGLLGAGSFATGTLLPAIKHIGGVHLAGVCAATGSHSQHAAQRFGFRYCTTDEETILKDPGVNTIVIATRHHLHARQVLAALRSGKNVFCEKPLCLKPGELSEIVEACEQNSSKTNPVLMVGFNRRFATLAMRMKNFLKDAREPLALHYRVNAGFIPAEHWLNDPEQGGGRILGEVCHFVDFLTFLAGSAPIEVQTHSLANPGKYCNDNVVSNLRFADGSQGTVSYLANGDKSFSKERIEVFGGGAVAVLEDFRRLELVREGRKQVLRSRLRPDKGHRAEWEAFLASLRNGGESPIPLAEIATTMLTTFALEESRSLGEPVQVGGLHGVQG